MTLDHQNEDSDSDNNITYSDEEEQLDLKDQYVRFIKYV